MTDYPEYLLLKWGGIKGWGGASEIMVAALERWHAHGVCQSAALHRNSAEQIAAICDVIDACEGTITNDWSGETYTKEQAKKYILEYPNNAKILSQAAVAE